MSRGILVPHVSGARVVVAQLEIGNAWLGVLTPPPGPHVFEARLAALLARAGAAEVRARPLPRAAPQGLVYEAGPPAAPRWLAVAHADVDDGERRRSVAFGWFTSRAMAASVEELLVDGIHDVALEGDVLPAPARAEDAATPTHAMHMTKDGADVWLEALDVRFVVGGWPPDALEAWAPRAERLPMARGIDAPVLVRAAFTGPRIQGARTPALAEHTEAELLLAWVAPAPGRSPLRDVVASAIAGVAWHARATPL